MYIYIYIYISTTNYNWLHNYPPAYMQKVILTYSINIKHIILTAKSRSPIDVQLTYSCNEDSI